MMKKWVKQFTLTLFFLLLFIGVFNFFMDPFWCFDHHNHFNQHQKIFNERQQKSNKIYFSDQKYDTLLIGSSRTTYTNYNDFKPKHVFNYAASGMRPKEYKLFINFAVTDLKQPIKTIIIGVDFMGYLSYGESFYNNSNQLINNTKSPYYRWKALFSYDALNTSLRNFRNTIHMKPYKAYYTSDNIKVRPKNPPEKFNDKQYSVLEYARTEYATDPDPEYHNIMLNVKESFPNQEIVIYTTPVSLPLFNKMVETGHYSEYEDWLRKLVSIYGKVYHFMYINPVTTDYYNNFLDCNHAYPSTNTLIAKRIFSQYNDNRDNSFGILLTTENIENNLMKLRLLNHINRNKIDE